MPRLELTLEEYNSVMEARAFVDLNEFCNKVDNIVDTIMEDINMTQFLNEIDGLSGETEKKAEEGLPVVDSTAEEINDEPKADAKKPEQKAEEKKDEKGLLSKLGEKLHKIIAAITKFASRIIPTIISKIKGLFKDKKDKPAVQEAEINFLSEKALKEGVECVETAGKVISGQNGPDKQANGKLILETNKRLEELKSKIEAKDPNYVLNVVIKKGESLKAHKKVLIDMIKESKKFSTVIEIPLAKLKTVKVEEMEEAKQKAFAAVLSCYTNALAIAKAHIKLIAGSLKNINIALNVKDKAESSDNATTINA